MQKVVNVALAQIAPVWLNREATLEKVCASIADAADKGCQLVVFGEALVPGYPFWSAEMNGAAWNSPVQKAFHARYLEESVVPEVHLGAVRKLARDREIAVYLGIVERATDRGSHTLYCSLVYIDAKGIIQSVHRKLQPTYDERLSWGQGDGHGLRVHPLGAFTVGGLNCWENWMPLTRTALYAQGENIHVAVWPGSERNTREITPFIARESRSYVLSASSLNRKQDIPTDIPHAESFLSKIPNSLTDGGSCIAAPDGSWLIEPVINIEGVFTAELNLQRVLEERQNFDATGHYSRPDVLRLEVNRTRQQVVSFEDNISSKPASE